ncbi:hypothetical protein DFH06DRAFT_1365334 [Mycena polygramma]|nr:hypothetical protein DFH06DRAFT_1365334 [Mycena polygramma]
MTPPERAKSSREGGVRVCPAIDLKGRRRAREFPISTPARSRRPSSVTASDRPHHSLPTSARADRRRRAASEDHRPCPRNKRKGKKGRRSVRRDSTTERMARVRAANVAAAASSSTFSCTPLGAKPSRRFKSDPPPSHNAPGAHSRPSPPRLPRTACAVMIMSGESLPPWSGSTIQRADGIGPGARQPPPRPTRRKLKNGRKRDRATLTPTFEGATRIP